MEAQAPSAAMDLFLQSRKKRQVMWTQSPIQTSTDGSIIHFLSLQTFNRQAGSILSLSALTPRPGLCSSASHRKDGQRRGLLHGFFRNNLHKAPVLCIDQCMLNRRAEDNCRCSPVFLWLWEACKHLSIHYINTWTSSVLEELELGLQSMTVEYFTKVAALRNANNLFTFPGLSSLILHIGRITQP